MARKRIYGQAGDCLVPGCRKAGVFVRGYCSGHYERLRRYGDPLGGGRPKGECYQYFCDVVVPYEGDSCLIWPFHRKAGYGLVSINGKSKIASRVLCEIHNGPPPTPKHEAAHSCGNGSGGCVTKRHLRWATHQENIDDMVAHGTKPEGERHGRAKLTTDQVQQIRSMPRRVRLADIADHFGISIANASLIRRGETWTCV